MPNLTKQQQAEVKKEVDKQVERAEKRIHKKILKQTSKFGSEFKQHASTALVTALGLVVALAWKDFILALISHYTKVDILEKYPFIADLYTVMIVTLVGIIGLITISKWAKQPDNSNKLSDPDPTN
jgi:hypothetical protein